MLKPVAAAVLWFYAVASIWNGLAMESGWPAAAGFLLGVLVAVVVVAGPLHILGPSRAARARPAEKPTAVGALEPRV